MKMKVNDVPVHSCFLQGRTLRKKISENQVSTRNQLSGKVSTRKIKGNPDVEYTQCPLEMLGVGMRRHPEAVVEIGDGNPLKKRKK